MNLEPLPAPSSSGFTSGVVVRSQLHGGALKRRDSPLLAYGCLRASFLPSAQRRRQRAGTGRPPADSVAPLPASLTPPNPPSALWGSQDLRSLKVSSNPPVSGPNSSLLVRLNSAQELLVKVWALGTRLTKLHGWGREGPEPSSPPAAHIQDGILKDFSSLLG